MSKSKCARRARGEVIKKLTMSSPPRAQIKTNTPPGGILLILHNINIVLQYNYYTIV